MIRSRVYFALTLVAMLATACRRDDSHGGPAIDKTPVTVQVVTVQSHLSNDHDELLGSVVARQRADIQTKLQTRVDRIPVGIGSRVREGDLLVEFDTRESMAHVVQARAMHEQAAADLKRFEVLLSQGAATQQEYDGVKARKTVAEAALQEAEAVLTYARITAPFSGTITRKDINEGDLAVPGRPLLSIEDGSSLQLVVSVPESQRSRIAIGDTMRVALTRDSSTMMAVVEELSPSADPVSRTLTAKLVLVDRERAHPGQTVRLLVPREGSAEISLPRSAIVRRGQLELVYVVSSDNQASLRLIRTGRQMNDVVEILSGLSDGDRVVLSPPAGLVDHDPVEVAP